MKGVFVVRYTSQKSSLVYLIKPLKTEHAKSHSGIIRFIWKKEAICKRSVIKSIKSFFKWAMFAKWWWWMYASSQIFRKRWCKSLNNMLPCIVFILISRNFGLFLVKVTPVLLLFFMIYLQNGVLSIIHALMDCDTTSKAVTKNQKLLHKKKT